MIPLNSDSYLIPNYELTKDDYLNCWAVLGVANQNLKYPDRIEYTIPEHLFNEDSITTAMGKPICRTHPPRALNAHNRQKYAIGSLLQEYSQDGDKLVMAAQIWHPPTIQEILQGKIKYTSAGYQPIKQLNEDGRYLQIFKEYNHLAVLPEDYAPRAGEQSRILNLDDSAEPEELNMQQNNQQTNENIGERVELWSEWRPFIIANNKTIDFNLDSRGIKKLILSCIYPEKTLRSLNNDSLLDGFWINFELNKDSILDTRQEEQEYSQNQDSKTSAYDAYVAKITGKK
jgi:hypothetical protein